LNYNGISLFKVAKIHAFRFVIPIKKWNFFFSQVYLIEGGHGNWRFLSIFFMQHWGNHEQSIGFGLTTFAYKFVQIFHRRASHTLVWFRSQMPLSDFRKAPNPAMPRDRSKLLRLYQYHPIGEYHAGSANHVYVGFIIGGFFSDKSVTAQSRYR